MAAQPQAVLSQATAAATTPTPATDASKKRSRDGEVAAGVTKVWVKTPLFLTKTFEMISQCDPNIATWTEKGDMFVVKDSSILASSYIPRYFGHANFSSFTRQLNFYGFRKVFPESVLRKVANKGPLPTGKDVENTDKYVSFHHELFHRDHPELLQKIRRSSTAKKPKPSSASSASREHELEDLRTRVSSLENRLSLLASEMDTKIAKMSADFDVKMAKMRQLVMAITPSENPSGLQMATISVGLKPGAPTAASTESKPPTPGNTGSDKEEKQSPSPLPSRRTSLTSLPSRTTSLTSGVFPPRTESITRYVVDRMQLSPTPDAVPPMTVHPKPAPKIGRLSTEEFFKDIFVENGVPTTNVTTAEGPASSTQAAAAPAPAASEDSDRICSTLLLLANQNVSPSRSK